MLRILSVFTFCYHIYRYGEGETHSTSAQGNRSHVGKQNVVTLVYTIRFVSLIYRPDGIGAQIFRVFWQPMNDQFMEIKIGSIRCSATDFLKWGRHYALCEWGMRIYLKQLKHSKWRILKGQQEDLLRKKLHALHNLHGTIYRPDKTSQQIVPCKPALTKKYWNISLNLTKQLWN